MARARQQAEGQLTLFDFIDNEVVLNQDLVENRAASEDGKEVSAPVAPIESVQDDQFVEPEDQVEAKESGFVQLEEAMLVDFTSHTGGKLSFDAEVKKPTGAKSRIVANFSAIETLAKLAAEKRWATRQEQEILSAYTSWGGLGELFDKRKAKYALQREQLSNLVSKDIYRLLRSTTLNGYYTPPEVSEAVNRLANKLAAGKDTVRVLEPAHGLGSMRPKSLNLIGPNFRTVGIEKDPVAAAISQYLHPDDQIIASGFETVKNLENSFDLAVTNVPFGSIKISDEVDDKSYLIHDYFILKTLQAVAPGGYAIFITSTGTADKADMNVRTKIAERADFIDAVRLPENIFTGTSVASDLLIFRVREEGSESNDATNLFSRELGTIEAVNEVGNQVLVPINTIFTAPGRLAIRNPAELTSTVNHHNQLVLNLPGDIDTAVAGIDAIVSRVDEYPRHFLPMTSQVEAAENITVDDSIAQAAARQHALLESGLVHFGEVDGKEQFYAFDENHEKVPIRVVKRDVDEVRALIEIRDLTHAIVSARKTDDVEAEIEALAQLEDTYSSYVEQYGALSRRTDDRLKVPTATQVSKQVEKMETQWLKQNGFEDRDAIPDDIRQSFYEQASQPTVVPGVSVHLKAFRNDTLNYTFEKLETWDGENKVGIKNSDFFVPRAGQTVRQEQVTYSLSDATSKVLSNDGSLDVDEISRLTGISVDEIPRQLAVERLAFVDPDSDFQLMPAAKYLSGHLFNKLAKVKEVLPDHPELAVNADVLQETLGLNEDLEKRVDIPFGARWVPKEVYESFISEKLGIPRTNIKLHLIGGEYRLNQSLLKKFNRETRYAFRGHYRPYDYKYGLIVDMQGDKTDTAGTTFSTKTAMYASLENFGIAKNGLSRLIRQGYEVMEDCLNSTTSSVNHSKDAKEAGAKGLIHPEATRYLIRQQNKIRSEFSGWLAGNPEIKAEVEQIFRERVLSYRAPHYDGSSRELPGLGAGFTPYSYQKDAVERIVSEPSVLLNHAVGAGKTGTMIMGAMELKRLGISNQPWIVVPNHLVGQIAQEANQWYPDAQILSDDGIDTKNARLFVNQANSIDWDIVIVSQAMFSSLTVSQENRKQYFSDVHDALERALEAQDLTEKGVDYTNIAERLESLRYWAAKQMEKNPLGKRAIPQGLFEETACDYLMVDEAHNYKNLYHLSDTGKVTPDGAMKAQDLDMKIQFLRKRREDAGLDPFSTPTVTFASGTPISNNLAEIWIMAHYLRPDLLEEMQMPTLLDFHTSWVKNEEIVEVAPSGVGSVLRSRNVGYENVSGLAGAFSVFSDVVSKTEVGAKLPLLATNERQTITFDLEDEVKDFIFDLDRRYRSPIAEHLGMYFEKKQDEYKLDNPLKIINDGRNVTLHPMLANLRTTGITPRVDKLTDKVVQVWQENKDVVLSEGQRPGCLQVIFCDRGTPKGAGRFSVYDDIRKTLVDKGMEQTRIAFVHDHDNLAELYRRCREGEIDVLLGSTPKLGTGANIQTRLKALHHVDVPWTPADLEQREGRILRQGNLNEEVEIYTYVAEGSSDAIMWNTLSRKQVFIDDFNSGIASIQDIALDATESISEAVDRNAAIAVGSGLEIKLKELLSEKDKLETAEQEYNSAKDTVEKSRQQIVEQISKLPSQIQQFDRWSELKPVAHDSVFYSRLEDGVKDAVSDGVYSLDTDIPMFIFSDKFSGEDNATVKIAVGMPYVPGYEFLTLDTGINRNRLRKLAFSGKPYKTYVDRILEKIDEVQSLIPQFKAQLEEQRPLLHARLRSLEVPDIPGYDPERLKQLEKEISELQKEMNSKENRERKAHLEQQRAQRLAEKARDEYFSLALNPTPVFAQHFGVAPEDMVLNQWRKEDQGREVDDFVLPTEIVDDLDEMSDLLDDDVASEDSEDVLNEELDIMPVEEQEKTQWTEEEEGVIRYYQRNSAGEPQLLMQRWVDDNGDLYRPGGGLVQVSYIDEQDYTEIYYSDDYGSSQHAIDYVDGKPTMKVWLNNAGQPHREDGPANWLRYSNGDVHEEFWIDGHIQKEVDYLFSENKRVEYEYYGSDRVKTVYTLDDEPGDVEQAAVEPEEQSPSNVGAAERGPELDEEDVETETTAFIPLAHRITAGQFNIDLSGAEVSTDADTGIVRYTWSNAAGELHREDGPACVEMVPVSESDHTRHYLGNVFHYRDGQRIGYEIFYPNGDLQHRVSESHGRYIAWSHFQPDGQCQVHLYDDQGRVYEVQRYAIADEIGTVQTGKYDEQGIWHWSSPVPFELDPSQKYAPALRSTTEDKIGFGEDEGLDFGNDGTSFDYGLDDDYEL